MDSRAGENGVIVLIAILVWYSFFVTKDPLKFFAYLRNPQSAHKQRIPKNEKGGTCVFLLKILNTFSVRYGFSKLMLVVTGFSTPLKQNQGPFHHCPEVVGF